MEIDKKTSLGLSENIEGALCYSFGFVTGIILLFLEDDNKFVRFHAVQSIIVFLPLFIIYMAITFLPMIGMIMNMMYWPIVIPIFSIIVIIFWLFMMYKAFIGEKYKLPIAGNFAERQI
jgi:uncharacterized membrane protein